MQNIKDNSSKKLEQRLLKSSLALKKNLQRRKARAKETTVKVK